MSPLEPLLRAFHELERYGLARPEEITFTEPVFIMLHRAACSAELPYHPDDISFKWAGVKINRGTKP